MVYSVDGEICWEGGLLKEVGRWVYVVEGVGAGP